MSIEVDLGCEVLAVEDFIQLDDTPSTYVGQAGKYPKVNGTEDGLEFFFDGDYDLPENYGAIGDGVSDDTIPLKAAFASSKNLMLPKGKTYLISDSLEYPSDKHVIGYGATIKRANSAKTELSANALLGDTVISVVDASVFTVGDFILITDSTGVYGGIGDLENSRSESGAFRDSVVSVDTALNTITITNSDTGGLRLPFTGNLDGLGYFATGNAIFKVYNIFPTLGQINNRVLEGVSFDGNKSNNQWTADWTQNGLGFLLGKNVKIINNQLLNLPSDGFTVSGEGEVSGNYLSECNGGLIHISNQDNDAEGLIVSDNIARNICLEYPASFHAEALITLSNAPRRIVASENVVTGSNGMLIGIEHATSGGYELDVFNNTCKDMFRIFEMDNQNQNAYKRVSIQGNIFTNCGDLRITGQPQDVESGGIDQISIKNNTITDGRFYVSYVRNFEISGNKFRTSLGFNYPTVDTAAQLKSQIYVAGIDGNISNNNLIAPVVVDAEIQNGIILDTLNPIAADVSFSSTQRVIMNSNTVVGYQKKNIGGVLGNYGGGRSIFSTGVLITGNTIGVNRASSSGIQVEPGWIARGNTIIVENLASASGMIVYGVTATSDGVINGGVATGNFVYGEGVSITVGTSGDNQHNAIVDGNFYQKSITDNTSANSLISNNILLNPVSKPVLVYMYDQY